MQLLKPPFLSNPEVVAPDEELQRSFVHRGAFGERESFSHQPCGTLPQGEVESLDMRGLPAAFLNGSVNCLRDDRPVAFKKVGKDLPVSVLGRNHLPELSTSCHIPVSHCIADNLAGRSAKSNPDPGNIPFHPHKGPEFISLKRGLVIERWNKSLGKRRQSLCFFLASGSPSDVESQTFSPGPSGCSSPRRLEAPSRGPLQDSPERRGCPCSASHNPGRGISVSRLDCGRSGSVDRFHSGSILKLLSQPC
jgi:hypothetical protein